MTNDKEMEQKIAEVGANIVPRVTAGKIDSLMESLTYQSWIVPNTTCTVVASTLPSKRVLTISQCTDAKTPEESYDIALQQCIDASRKKLMRIVS